MRKLFFITLIVLFNNSIFSQNIGLTAKYNTHIGNSYGIYTSFAFEGLFSFNNNMFEVGPTIGFHYSKFPNNLVVKNPRPDFFTIDNANISKVLFGGSLYFYPITFVSIYSPFIGIRGVKLSDNKSFLFFTSNGGGMIFGHGYYNFSTKDDYIYSVLSGIKITTKVINIILELEYQQRHFTLEYDEYDDSPIEIANHSKKRSINAFNFGIGLQFVF